MPKGGILCRPVILTSNISPQRKINMKKLTETLKRILFYRPEYGKGLAAVHWTLNGLFLLLWCCGCGVVGLYLAKVGYGPELFWSYFQKANIVLLNLLPGLLLALVLLFATGRVWPAVLGSGILSLGVAVINYYKMLFRDDPLLFEDILSMVEAAQISAGYTFTLPPAIALSALVFIAAVVFAVFLMKARIRKPALRVAGTLIALAACVLAYRSLYADGEVYEKTENLKVEFAEGYSLNRWNESDQYRSRGYMYPFLHSVTELVDLKPEGYDRREAEAALESLGGGDIPENEKVNIISIMLEAYCDLSVYDSVGGGFYDPYGFFHELQSESVHGSLITNIFAGGTMDTERCFISGSTVMYEYRGYADSYARYFAEQGYRTEFCHPGYEWFYNRQNVMDYLGFEAGYFHENRYLVETGHAGDRALFEDIIKLYEDSRAAGEPYFNFSVTYQNHGPYPYTHFNDPYKVVTAQGDLPMESYRILTNYLEGIHRTDESLRYIVDYFRSEEEPVILVLFGDHKPWLGDGSFVYSQLGIDLHISDRETMFNYYETPYLIWANDAAKAVFGSDFEGEGEAISPCFLMMKLFDLAGWEGDGYTNALRELHAAVSVVNDAGLYLVDGEMREELEGDALEKLRLVERLQYYRMKDSK